MFSVILIVITPTVFINLTNSNKSKANRKSFFGDTCVPNKTVCEGERMICIPVTGKRSVCQCEPRHFYNKKWKKCKQMRRYGDYCTSNAECEAFDINSYCDYAPVFRHDTPICSCKLGTLFDNSSQKCSDCSPLDKNCGGGSEHVSPSSNSYDTLRLILPLKIILSAVTLVLVLSVVFCFCSRLVRQIRDIYKRQFNSSTVAQSTADVVDGRLGTVQVDEVFEPLGAQEAHYPMRFSVALPSEPPPTYEEAMKHNIIQIN